MTMTPEQIALYRSKELIDTLWNDGEVGKKIQQAAKAKWNDIKTTDDIMSPIVEPHLNKLKEMEEKYEKLLEERLEEKRVAEDERVKVKLEEQLEKARRDYNLTEEGFNQMIDRMKATGNYSDAEAAAAYVASKAPPAKVAGPTWAPQDLDLFGSKNRNDALVELHRDPMGYMDSQLTEFVSDPDKYVRDTFGRAA
jgi:vacuolar-type H+-ATPase subunit I/STV1